MIETPNIDLSYLPDYQRAAVTFIDSQIAHLDSQRERLVEARDFLMGFRPLVQTPTIAAPAIEADEVDETDEREVVEIEQFERVRPKELLPRLKDFLAVEGPLRIGLIERMMGVDRLDIRATMKQWPNLFVCEGEKSNAEWRLLKEDEVAA